MKIRKPFRGVNPLLLKEEQSQTTKQCYEARKTFSLYLAQDFQEKSTKKKVSFRYLNEVPEQMRETFFNAGYKLDEAEYLAIAFATKKAPPNVPEAVFLAARIIAKNHGVGNKKINDAIKQGKKYAIALFQDLHEDRDPLHHPKVEKLQKIRHFLDPWDAVACLGKQAVIDPSYALPPSFETLLDPTS